MKQLKLNIFFLLFCSSLLGQSNKNSISCTYYPFGYLDLYIGSGAEFSYGRSFKYFDMRVSASLGHANGNYFDTQHVDYEKYGRKLYSTDIPIQNYKYSPNSATKNHALQYYSTDFDKYSHNTIGLIFGLKPKIDRKWHVLPYLGCKLGVANFTYTYEVSYLIDPPPSQYEHAVYINQVHAKYLYWGLTSKLEVTYDLRDYLSLGLVGDLTTHKYYINDLGKKFVFVGLVSTVKF